MNAKQAAEAKPHPRSESQRFARIVESGNALVCDTCGKCWADDSESDRESCTCGRFKQRMEWATIVEIAKDADAATREREGEIRAKFLALDAAIGAAIESNIEDKQAKPLPRELVISLIELREALKIDAALATPETHSPS